MTQTFSCEFGEVSKNTSSYRAPPVAASIFTLCQMFCPWRQVPNYAYLGLIFMYLLEDLKQKDLPDFLRKLAGMLGWMNHWCFFCSFFSQFTILVGSKALLEEFIRPFCCNEKPWYVNTVSSLCWYLSSKKIKTRFDFFCRKILSNQAFCKLVRCCALVLRVRFYNFWIIIL